MWEADIKQRWILTALLTLLFSRYGDIESIRVLHERFCAFVNFRDASMAARAMEKLNVSVLLRVVSPFVSFIYINVITVIYEGLYVHVCSLSQGHCIENTRLVVRYPDRRTQRPLPTPLKTCVPVTQQGGTAAG